MRYLLLFLISTESFAKAGFYNKPYHRSYYMYHYPYTLHTFNQQQQRREGGKKQGTGDYYQSLKKRPNVFKYKYGKGTGYGCGQRSSCEWGYGSGYGCGTKKYISDCKIEVEKMWSDEGKKRYHQKK